MTQPTSAQQDDRVSRFVAYLRGFVDRDDRGALAALRRSLQESSGISMSACPYIVPFLPSTPSRAAERVFFLIGALFALHPSHAEGISLGHVFRRINATTREGQKGTDNESVRARFVALLDAHVDDVADHLRHAVSLARSKDVPLDWARLCRDLLGWETEDRRVQRRLASDFWSHPDPDAQPAPETASPSTETKS